MGWKGNTACYSRGGTGDNEGGRDDGNGGKREDKNNSGPAGEYTKQRRMREVLRGR